MPESTYVKGQLCPVPGHRTGPVVGLSGADDGVFGLVDPHTLFIGDNVRDIADLDTNFIDSIRQHGVLVPVTVVRDENGTLIVRDGQRRTLAAREATLPTIPVYVIPTAARDLPAWNVERVVQQIVANDQHAILNDAQRARGIQQLLDAGLTVAKTAKLLSKPRKVVKSASEATQSDAAMAALANGQLSLDQAAAVAEFADDDAAVSRLIDASPGHFEHLLSRLRRERITARVTAAAAEAYREQGYRILDEAPRWGDLTCLSIDELVTAGGEPARDDHVAPDHWAVRLVEEERLFDAETDEPVEDDNVDLDTQWSPSRAAREGLRHFSSVVERWVPVPHFYCTDHTAVGLVPSPPVLAAAARTSEGPSAGPQDTAPESGPGSRRSIVALNRLSEAATEVRRRWVKDKLLATKKPHKGAAVFVADMLVRDRTLLGDFRAPDEAAALLGLTGEAAGLQTYVEGLPASSDGPAQLVALALVLGALESRYSKDCWRDGGQSWRTVGPRDLLRYLSANGYVLSDIERVVLGELEADEVSAA